MHPEYVPDKVRLPDMGNHLMIGSVAVSVMSRTLSNSITYLNSPGVT